MAPISEKELEMVSDSEMQTRQTQEDLENKQKESLRRSLEYLVKQLDATNTALVNVKETLKDNSKQTIDYISNINQSVIANEPLDSLQKPELKDLTACLHDLGQKVRNFNR